MSLLLYSSKQPTEIAFQSDDVRFTAHDSIKAIHTILIRNTGIEALTELNLIYPRDLISKLESNTVQVIGLKDLITKLPELLPFTSRLQDQQLQVDIPDPNSPELNIPNVVGTLSPSNARLGVPEGIGQRELFLIQNERFTFLRVFLKEPIRPSEAHWFCWQVEVTNIGTTFNTFLGHVGYHKFCSPLFVGRTLELLFQAGVSDFEVFSDHPDHLEMYKRVLNALDWQDGLQTTLRYYLLRITPGDPMRCLLLNWNQIGDIRLLVGSPDISSDSDGPIFSWKSGSLIKAAEPWKGQEFFLTLMLGYKQL